MKTLVNPTNLLRTALRDNRGATALIVAMAIVVLVGMAGFVIDIGHAYAVQRTLQASSDAAALAGAQDIPTSSAQAIATATAYSSVAGNKNAVSTVTATMVSGYPQVKCFTSTGVACTGPSGGNGIVVKQQATVPMWFAQVLGISSMVVSATSTAGISGGLPKPLDVMIVLDATASMNQADPSCSIAGATKIVCALAGVRTVLNTLAPSADQIGVMIFPGTTSAAQAKLDYDCSASTVPAVAAYNASPVYQIVPLSSDYRSSNSATTLNPSSNLSLASGGISSCAAGISAKGGVGTYFADAITAAQASLVANGKAGAQKVIILLSDGDAGASAANMPVGKATNQCHAAITAAQNAATAKTWVYSIAYNASTSAASSCGTDKPPISACSTMQQIASDSGQFYSDTGGLAGGCASASNSVSELVSVFQSIAFSLVPPRLLSDTTS